MVFKFSIPQIIIKYNIVYANMMANEGRYVEAVSVVLVFNISETVSVSIIRELL
jgi:hypothetical protein